MKRYPLPFYVTPVNGQDCWHPLLSYPYALSILLHLQPELILPNRYNAKLLDAISDYLFFQRNIKMPPALEESIDYKLTGILYGIKHLLSRHSGEELLSTLQQKKLLAGWGLLQMPDEEIL